MRISDWSSDVCSSDLTEQQFPGIHVHGVGNAHQPRRFDVLDVHLVRAPIADRRFRRLGASGYPGRMQAEFGHPLEIGRASCRERVCQYVWIPVVAVSLKKKHTTNSTHNTTPQN